MIIVYITLILSFLLDGTVTNIIPMNSNLFVPLLSIMALIIIYPYFKNDGIRYLEYAFIYGLIYDLVYTDTLILNAIVFTFIGLIIIGINILVSNNFLNISFIAALVIISYRVLTYFVLVFTRYLTFDINALFKSITSSLLLNIIYILISFLITDRISRKFHIEKMD